MNSITSLNASWYCKYKPYWLIVCALAWSPAVPALGQGDPAAGNNGSTPEPLMAPLPRAPSHTGGGQAPRTEAAAADALRRAAATLSAAPAATVKPSPAVKPSGGAREIDATDLPASSANFQAVDATTRIDSPLEGLIKVNRLAKAQQYQQAIAVSRKVVTLSERAFGQQSLATANAYVLLGKVQNKAGEHRGAEKSLLTGIGMIRASDGQFSARVIKPLIGLGDNYQAAGRYLDAISAYSDARSISRRIYGLTSKGQIPILERISDSFMQLDNYKDANEQQLVILRLSERRDPIGTEAYLNGIYRYATWLGSVSRYQRARQQYAEAIRIIHNKHGSDSPLLIRPLRETGISYRMQRVPDDRGLGALYSALEIIRKQPQPDPLKQAELLRDIGDWQVAFSRGSPDLDAYTQAWQLLGSTKNSVRLRKEWFRSLNNVLQTPINREGLSEDPDALHGHVTIQFDIDPTGHTRNVKVIDSEPAGLKDKAVVKALRNWRYRPFMRDGKIVRKGPVAVRLNYQYEPGADNK